MNPADKIERAIEQLHITTRAETDRNILDDAFAALEKSAQKQSPYAGLYEKRRILRIRIAELAAVAAVILVIFALFFGTPVEGVTLGQVIQAVEKVRNICVSRFDVDEAEPYQQVWTSQIMKVIMFKNIRGGQPEYVLWDLPNRTIMSVFSGSVDINDISANKFAQGEKALTITPGLIPIEDINPENSQWNRVEDPNILAIVPGTEVYDLTWPQKSTTGTGIRFIKNRFFVDPFTHLPKRIEHYTKLKTEFRSEEKYRFRNFTVITYPIESQIRTLIHNAFGPAALQPRAPVYRGTPPPN